VEDNDDATNVISPVIRDRQYFDQFATEKGFDPLNASNWYKLTLSQLRKRKGGVKVQLRHGGFRKALQDAYPELAFSKWNELIASSNQPLAV